MNLGILALGICLTRLAILPETNRPVDKTAAERGLIPPPASPHGGMSQWIPTPREPAKTKAELREMLAEAVRNTAHPEPKLPEAPKPPPKASKDRG